jgi:hypothetical protein
MLLVVSLWKKQPGQYFCISTKSASGKWKDNWFKKSELKDVPDFVDENLDKNVYFCPHGFSKPERKKEFAVPPRMLYADLDESDPRKLDLEPTIALESSPGRFVGFWETDEEIEESLNRRLSYSIGADVSGWDLTQVLRFPNTRNYKYHTTPRVRILWNNGPTYETRRLDKMIPQIKNVMGEDLDNQAAKTFKRYEKKMPRWLRRELLQGKPTPGKRSEVLWKMQNELLEIGMSREEAFDVLWVCPWNKFRTRRDGVDQLWRELDKSLDQHFAGYQKSGSDEDDDPTEFNPLPRSMADVVMRNINWIVPGMFARGEVTIVEGDPGLGKSYFMQIVSGNICDGKTIPCEVEYEPHQGRIAYFDTENTADTVTKIRLIENGIECLENYWQGEEPFTIDDEEKWDRVAEILEDFRPTLTVFDTINTYIGSADTYRSSETQQALGNFKQLASRFDCAVILLRHLTKGGKEKALYRGQGSIAFTGVARIVLTIGLHPEDQDIRVVACTKNNIGPKMRSFTYRIDSLPDTPKAKNRSKLTWGEFVDLTSDDIVSVAPIKNKDGESAVKWLKELLETRGKSEVSRIERMSAARSISKTNIHRAADQLGIVKSSRGEGKLKREFWALPSGDETPNESESHGRKHLKKSTKRSIQF